MLYAVFYVLCSVFCVLCSVFCVLCSVFCQGLYRENSICQEVFKGKYNFFRS